MIDLDPSKYRHCCKCDVGVSCHDVAVYLCDKHVQEMLADGWTIISKDGSKQYVPGNGQPQPRL